MSKEQNEQRSEFQFSLIKYNLGASGALMAFALSPDGDYQHALLVVPVISFTLFCLWMHHALVIRLSEDGRDEPSRHVFFESLRRHTFSVSILMNFALIPTGALLLYEGEKLRYLYAVDIVLVILVFILYGMWFYLQYSKKNQ